jgi:hypothetical protein
MTIPKGAIYLIDGDDRFLLPAFGRKLSIEKNQQVREERTASGKLVRDIISTKSKITLTYSEMDGDDLDEFDRFYNIQSELILWIFYDDGLYTEYTVLMNPIDRERILLKNVASAGELWGSVSVVFNEV